MNSMKHVELLLFAACWWYLLLDGNIVTAYYSRNAFYPNSRDDVGNDVWHLISDSGEAAMFNVIISGSIFFLELLVNNEKQSSDHDEPGNSREVSNPEFQNIITISPVCRTGALPGTFISNCI